MLLKPVAGAGIWVGLGVGLGEGGERRKDSHKVREETALATDRRQKNVLAEETV